MISDIEKWIWLDKEKYPGFQNSSFSAMAENKTGEYTVAEFLKKYQYEKNIKNVNIRFSADTEVQLYCNGTVIATGPACVGGDFLFNDFPRPSHYASVVSYHPEKPELEFFARVKLNPVGTNEYSKGHGGFMLTAEVEFCDGTKKIVCTDETWLARRNGAFAAPYEFDSRVKPDEYDFAVLTPNIWHCVTAPIPVRSEEELFPVPALNSGETGEYITVLPHEFKQLVLGYDKIYAGFVKLSVKTEGLLEVTVNCFETDEGGTWEKFAFDSDCEYRGFQLHSIGGYRVSLNNRSDSPARVKISMIATCYPAREVCHTKTSDAELNKVLEVCAHTLKYCRQSIHLDSPRHSEPLACTGDYYIESLMTAFSYGDMALSEFDVIRTAELLRYHDGRMFHTTYSFDHSHAWGGSPLYSIPKALLGIDILEAGYRKIRLDPSLLGLEAASVEIPTPFGKISCIMKKGEKIKLNVPKEITVEYKKIQINKKFGASLK